MDNELIQLLFPNQQHDAKYYDNMYPARDLEEGAIVSRFAPSPTGFVHMGSMLVAYTDFIMAHQSNGVFILRIEDTDEKRTVENGIQGIIDDLASFNIVPDEGPMVGGNYGPYIQTERLDIYHAFIIELLKNDYAYPCFLTESEGEDIRKYQEENKLRLGIYGKFATSRNLSIEEVKKRIQKGEEYVIRFKSRGDFTKQRTLKDLVKGTLTFPENDMDFILLKKDGVPVYAFAHIVDDYLMRISHVIRGDEWVSSLPMHVELIYALGFPQPKYAHISPLTKREGDTVRKLSKRKDPEASIRYYVEKGIPINAAKLYFATIMHPSFESWYMQNSDKNILDFPFEFKKMPVGGTYFDLEKLNSVSKIYISKMKATDLYEEAVDYFETYDSSFAELLKKYKDRSIAMLNIEREVKRPRKDISCYSDIKPEFSYFFEELFIPNDTIKNKINFDFMKEYLDIYNELDDKETWFHKIKDLGSHYGYAKEVKEFKDHPEAYSGHVGDACEMIRLVMTGREMSPDLYEVLQILGKDILENRISLLQK